MPILHVQTLVQGQDPNGDPVVLPPNVGLMARGPCVQVAMTVAQDIAQQLLQQGQSPPAPETGWALIDTGATSTCIDEAAAQRLHLPAVDVAQIASASHASSEHNVYPVSFEIVGLPMQINAPRAIGVELAAQGILALIGRDLLAQCTLHYNGLAGQFTISI